MNRSSVESLLVDGDELKGCYYNWDICCLKSGWLVLCIGLLYRAASGTDADGWYEWMRNAPH